MPFTLFLYAWLSFSFCFLYSFLPSRSTLLCFSTSLFPLSSWLFFRRFYEIPSRIHGTSCPVHVVNYRVEERSRTLSLPPWTRNSSLEDSIVPPCAPRMLTIPRTIVGLYHRSSSSRYGAYQCYTSIRRLWDRLSFFTQRKLFATSDKVYLEFVLYKRYGSLV